MEKQKEWGKIRGTGGSKHTARGECSSVWSPSLLAAGPSWPAAMQPDLRESLRFVQKTAIQALTHGRRRRKPGISAGSTSGRAFVPCTCRLP
jgi:hypothetical protein